MLFCFPADCALDLTLASDILNPIPAIGKGIEDDAGDGDRDEERNGDGDAGAGHGLGLRGLLWVSYAVCCFPFHLCFGNGRAESVLLARRSYLYHGLRPRICTVFLPWSR